MNEIDSTVGFVVEIYEENTGCIRELLELRAVEVSLIETVLHIDSFEPHHAYELESEDITALNCEFALAIDDREWLVMLRRRIPLDDLPYQVHTNRELALMLSGEKPLSVFHLEAPSEDNAYQDIEKFFEPHVASGRLVQREVTNEGCSQSLDDIRTVLYALPNEAWRIDAYLMMKSVARRCGWNEGFERMEGRLLGYTEEQNDLFMAFLRRQRP